MWSLLLQEINPLTNVHYREDAQMSPARACITHKQGEARRDSTLPSKGLSRNVPPSEIHQTIVHSVFSYRSYFS